MASYLTLGRLLLAQAESSNVTDFLEQIGGLLGLTCAAGIIWLALMAFVFQRAAERRRRAAQGLEPLLPLHTSLWRTLRAARATDPALAARLKPASAGPLPRPAAPAPDLALLTAEGPPAPAGDDRPAAPPDPRPEALEPWDDAPAAPGEPVPAPLSADPAPEPAPEAAPVEPGDAVELLRVWRDLSTGELIMEIGGRRFRSVDELRSADLERRFSGVVRDLNTLVTRPAAPPPVEPFPTARPGGLRQIGRVALGQPPVETPSPAPRTIADQIEDLLQARLAGAPPFRGRAIHVRPALHGGVQIVVDNQQYEGIGEIDDPEVRALLEDVVREWEASQ